MNSPAKAQPLAGVRVLVGRARHQASKLSENLTALGAEVIEIPFIEIRKPESYKPLDTALHHIANYDWLILTSVNGVRVLAERMEQQKIGISAVRHLQIAAIGPATREAIEKLGLNVAVVPERYVAESVVDALREKVNGRRILLARAKVARDVIPRELAKVAAQVDVVDAYETIIPELSRKRLRDLMSDDKQRPDIITFTSSSTVTNFVELLGGAKSNRAALDGIRLASIGPVTSATLCRYGLPVHIEALEYTIPGLVRAIASSVSGS